MNKEIRMVQSLGEYFFNDKTVFTINDDVVQIDIKDKKVSSEISRIFPFYFEILSKNEWTIDALLVPREDTPLLKYWKKCLENGLKQKKVPILIFTKEDFDWFILLDATLSSFPDNLTIPSHYLATIINEFNKRTFVLTMTKLSDFLKINKYSHSICAIKERYNLLVK